MNKYRIISVLILIILMNTSGAWAALWYVDNAATGANNGTSWTDAWTSFASINWAADVDAGDTIYISGGATSKTYSGGITVGDSGTQGSPITITVGQDAGHNGVIIIDGGSTLCLDIPSRSWITISGQHGAGTSKDMVCKNHTTDEIRLDTITGVDINYLEVGPNTVATGDLGDGFEVLNWKGGSNRIHHNDIHDAYDKGIVLRPLADFTGISNDGCLRIDHNTIRGLGDDGIHGATTTGCYKIDHNDIHTNPSDAQHSSGYSDGMQLRGLYYITVAYNKIHDLEGPDGMFGYIYIECDLSTCQPAGGAANVLIFNNVIWETQGGPFTSTTHTGISFGCKVCTTSSNFRILNNTIVDMENLAIDFGCYTANPCSDVVIANNIFYNGDRETIGTNRLFVAVRQLDATPTPTTGNIGSGADIIFDYNAIDVSNNDTVEYRLGAGTGTTYVGHAAFETACGCNANGTHNDPIFVSWTEGSGGDFHLSSADTAAKDEGTSRLEFSDDHDDVPRPQGNAWDIGAYEYVPSTGMAPMAAWLRIVTMALIANLITLKLNRYVRRKTCQWRLQSYISS